MVVGEKPTKKGSIISISFLLRLLSVIDSQGNKNLPEKMYLLSVNQPGVQVPCEVCGATLNRYSLFAEIVAQCCSEISQQTANGGEGLSELKVLPCLIWFDP